MTAQALVDDIAPSHLNAPEKRLHKRFRLKLVGRFMRADRHEFACELQDISTGGLAILSSVQPAIGENVIVYMDELGGLEGTVVRHFENGFALQLVATRHKREKLAARITWLVNRHEFGDREMRAHERVLPRRNTNTLQISDDVTLSVEVIDVSLSGANVATEARPPLGAEVKLGKMRAEVVRHHDRGIGIRFLKIQQPDTIRTSFG